MATDLHKHSIPIYVVVGVAESSCRVQRRSTGEEDVNCETACMIASQPNTHAQLHGVSAEKAEGRMAKTRDLDIVTRGNISRVLCKSHFLNRPLLCIFQ